MLKIAVCDDEKDMRNLIVGMTKSFLAKSDISAEITEFRDGESIADEYENNNADFSIVLLDIKMKDVNGISVAKTIRSCNKDTLIVFITSSAEYVFKGYEVKAFRYILKTELSHSFNMIMKECIEELDSGNNDSFLFQSGNENITLLYNEILYFESDKRKITVHTKKQEYCFYKKLDEIQSELSDKDFVRCHQSFIVNARAIKSINRTSLTLKNDTEIPISKSRIKATKDAYLWALR